MKRAVSTLSGALLDYFVAKADGREARILAPVVLGPNSPPAHELEGAVCYANDPAHPAAFMPFQPSSMWTDIGAIIDREKIALCTLESTRNGTEWIAHVGICAHPAEFGSTAQEAAARAFIASKLGNEVDEES